MNDAQQSELVAAVRKYSKSDGVTDTAIAALHCFKMSLPSGQFPIIYRPSLCLIVQGAKSVMLDREIFHYGVGEFLVVSVDLPTTGQITLASEDRPYLCLQLDIDASQLGDLIAQTGLTSSARSSRGLFIGRADEILTDCLLRLIRLLETPRDIAALAPMIVRESYYRLLQSEHGGKIAQLAIAGSIMQQIAKVIEFLKIDYRDKIRVEELAAMAHMSPSSFHHHFKQITALSPLQYQKRLRLQEARRLMMAELSDAASAAYRVGYDSPSQFSREYCRLFGAPPITDITQLRVASRGW
jgi:AraC-like DNA-binding protein